MVMTSKEDAKSSSRLAILMGIAFTAMSVALIAGGNVATEAIEWFRIPGCKGPVYYYLYNHGLASWMVFLSCGLSLVALISARGITSRSYRNFAIGIFSLMGAMNGTFLAADAVLFFFFFEAMVIPAAVLIAGFGGKDRMKAAMTFAIYTLVGSAPMMVALWYLLTIADNSMLISLAIALQSLQLRGGKHVDIGPRILLDEERCVQCDRCVRFMRSIAKDEQLQLAGRADHTYITTFPGEKLDHEYDLCVTDVCPTGAMTAKYFRFQKRVWLLSHTPTISMDDSLGANIWLDHADY